MPHTWDFLTRIALSKPYLAAWRALCWLRRPHIYTGDRVVLTRTIFGHWMYIDASDASVAPGLLIRGYWEIPATRVLLRLLRPGMRYVEVGSNVGYFTLLASSRVGPDGRVFAFEANPRLADLARRSLSVNGVLCARVEAMAVCEQSGAATLHVPAYHLGEGNLYSPAHPFAQGYATQPAAKLEVPATTLDDYFADDPAPVDLLRIDAEGSEPAILAGARELLARSPSIKIILELSPALIRQGGRDPEQFLESLYRDGFQAQEISGGGLVPYAYRESPDPRSAGVDLLLEHRRSGPAAGFNPPAAPRNTTLPAQDLGSTAGSPRSRASGTAR
ncbi:MAG: FkbM family methyltransferase [Acidobacteria bacterium]|nr:FkbM family methyltransferase [Acidobacteriota bacterium]